MDVRRRITSQTTAGRFSLQYPSESMGVIPYRSSDRVERRRALLVASRAPGKDRGLAGPWSPTRACRHLPTALANRTWRTVHEMRNFRRVCAWDKATTEADGIVQSTVRGSQRLARTRSG